MGIKEYLKACQDIFQSGYIKEGAVKEHIEQQLKIDMLLPNLGSFFFVVEPVSHTYHFMGRQQESVSGYPNEEVMKKGMAFLFECLHQDEIDILLEKIYPDISGTLAKISKDTDIKSTFTQFNYRFKVKNGFFINLLEHLYVLETDRDGKPALFLGNIFTMANKDVLPLRLTIKIMRGNGLMETVFFNTYNSKNSLIDNITARELDILRNLALGKTSKQIGKELFISVHTVDTHRRNLLKKLNCSSVVELTRVAFENGLL